VDREGEPLEPEEFQGLEAAFCNLIDQNVSAQALHSFLSELQCCAPTKADVALIKKLLSGFRRPGDPPRGGPGISRNDSHFVESIIALTHRSGLPRIDPPRSPWSIRDVGTELDFLACSCYLPNLSPIQVVNLLLLRRIQPSKSVAVVATIRDEGIYLLEWIAFQRAIGLADIFVYTNDNADGSDRLLTVLAGHGVIKLLRSSVRTGTNAQLKAYQHAIHLLHELRNYKWVMFLDADEFLVLKEAYDHNINEFLHRVESTFADSMPGAVLFPWDWRLSDLRFRRTAGLLFERYPHSVPHFCVKSATRLNATLGMCEVHFPTLAADARLVDSGLSPVERESISGREPKSDEGGSIAHFWGKSFQEYAIKKRRGDLMGLHDTDFKYEFTEYFAWTAKLSAGNLRPLPRILAKRVNRALMELKALPGVSPAIKEVNSRFKSFSRQVSKDMKLREKYNEMRSSIQPILDSEICGPAD